MAERDVPPGPDGAGALGDGPATGGRPGPAGSPPSSVPPPSVPPLSVPPPSSVPPLGLLATRSPIRVVRRPSHQTAALRQELAEKAAATDELRVALDELRHVLDVGAADAAAVPDRPPGRRRRRAGPLLAVTGTLATVAVIAVALLSWSRSGGTSDRPSPGSAAASGPVTGPAPVTAAPAADTPGTDVQVTVDGDGAHLDVVERLVLDGATATPLVLQAPGLPALGRPGIADLLVQLDGRDAAAVPGVPGGPGGPGTRWTASPAAGSQYTRATLRYRISGGIVAVTPAAPGRALGLVTPLTAMTSQARGRAVVVRAPDRHVVGVSCPGVQGSGSVCGARTARGWTASVPAGARPVVLLQINR